MIQILIKQIPGRSVKFGNYANLADAVSAATFIKSQPSFSGEVFVEHKPSLAELSILNEPAHTKLITV